MCVHSQLCYCSSFLLYVSVWCMSTHTPPYTAHLLSLSYVCIPAATVWGCTEEEGLAQLQSHMYGGPWSGTAQGEWMREHSHLRMNYRWQCVLTVYLLWNCTLRDTLWPYVYIVAIVSSWFMSGLLCWSCMENLCTYACTYTHIGINYLLCTYICTYIRT